LTSGPDGDVSIAFRRYAFAESRITERMSACIPGQKIMRGVDLDRIPELVAQRNEGDDALRAISNALSCSVSIITGGPGSGKTTTVAALLQTLAEVASGVQGSPIKVALCAPTAKAAVRMTEALVAAVVQDPSRVGVGLEEALGGSIQIEKRSGSVHRLLGIRPDNSKNPRALDHDLIIVDEVSMLETSLLATLLDCAPNANVVLVGDPNQLLSVNVGAVLRDMVDGCAATALSQVVTTLRGNYRSVPSIGSVADAIKDGEIDAMFAAIEQSDGAVTYSSDIAVAEETTLAWARSLVALSVENQEREALDALKKHVVLCATKQNAGSVQWWRDRIESKLGATPDSVTLRFRFGAPVLITQNEQGAYGDIDERLSNGEVGVAVPSPDGGEVIFDGVTIKRRPIRHVHRAETAWSMTIHKSQGSEYGIVVVSLPTSGSQTLSRELLYTAVTRAKQRVIIVGPQTSLENAVRRRSSRAGSLAKRLAAARVL
jgi:exodeoxyribonuclease V alpha subunit